MARCDFNTPLEIEFSKSQVQFFPIERNDRFSISDMLACDAAIMAARTFFERSGRIIASGIRSACAQNSRASLWINMKSITAFIPGYRF